MKLTDRFISPASMLLLVLSGPLVSEGRAQNRAAVVGAGPSSPVPLSAAPGGIITIFAAGLSPSVVPANAQSTALPTTLAGISASIPLSGATLVVPLISVFAAPTCFNTASPPCSTLTGIQLQIPFEVPQTIPGMGALTGPVLLVVTDRAGNSAAVDVTAFPDQIHVLTVTHSDGSLVSYGKPGKPGEVLVAYAVGLGLTNPQVGTGEPTPLPAPHTTTTFVINYDFSPNAAPSKGVVSASSLSTGGRAPFPVPLFVGLSPGNVGLYQLNFVVPFPPSGTLPCSGNIYSNLTVSFVGPNSFDGFPICVALPAI